MFGDSPDSQAGVYLFPALVGSSGVLLLLWSTAESVGLYLMGSPVLFEARYLVGYVTIVPCCLGLLGGGWWLAGSALPKRHHSRIAAYWAVGGGGFLAFNVALMAFFPTESVWLVTNWIRWALSIGLAIGLAIGIAQSRSIFNNLEAERQSLRARHLEKQRDLVDHLNGILRHEVLNATQSIVGSATLLMEDDEPIDPDDERLARIHRQGEELTRVIQDVRSVLNTMQNDRNLQPVDASTVVRSELRKITDRYPEVDVEDRLPADLTVEADQLLGRVFGNLLTNAVVHNDTEALTVTVDAEATPAGAVVTVQDDGTGIPESKRNSLFDRPLQGDHGLGLYLVREMVHSYGGEIELVETGPEGTTFEVRFPPVSAHEPDAGSRSGTAS